MAILIDTIQDTDIDDIGDTAIATARYGINNI